MLFDNFADLCAAIADQLNRTDLTTQIPGFIALAEAEIKREVQRAIVRDTSFSITAESNALPADCSELRSIHIESATPWRDKPFAIVTPEVLAEVRARTAAVADQPRFGAVFGTNIVVEPAPDSTYTATISYFQTLTPLSDSNTTNSVLTEAPDIYLNGAMKYANLYLKDTDTAATWDTLFQAAMKSLNEKRTREEYGASVRPARLPRVF